MDDARLSEIERKNRCEGHSIRDGDMPDADDIFYCGPNNADIVELIAEVRRLQAELTRIKQAAATEALFEEGDAEAIAILRRGFTGRPDTHIPEPQKD